MSEGNNTTAFNTCQFGEELIRLFISRVLKLKLLNKETRNKRQKQIN